MLAYNSTTWHRMSYRDNAKNLVNTIEDGKEKGYDNYKEFLGDIHSRLLTGDTVTQNEREGLDIYRALHNVASEIKEWASLVERTKGSSFLSSLGTQAIADGLGSRLPTIPEHAEDREDLERAKQLLEEQLALDPENEKIQDAMSHMGALIEDAEYAQEQALEAIGNSASSIRTGMRQQMQSAMEDIENIQKSARGCGLEEGTTSEQRETGLKSLAEALKNTPDLRKILDLAGRFDSLRRSTQNARSQYSRSEVVGIEQGRDISRLLIPELVKMEVSPEVFAADYFEGRLLQYRLEGTEKKGAGPIICLVDNSGSMDGDRTIWAKAVAVALMQQAKAENRPFALALYSTGIVKSFTFSKGSTMNLGELLSVLSYEPSGGTNVAKALEWAFNQIAEEKDADVVVISDGDDSSIHNPAWRVTVKSLALALKTRIFGVLIEERNASVIAQFKAFTSDFVQVNDLRKQAQTAAIDLFGGIVKK